MSAPAYAEGFKSQWNETDAGDLPVEGRIPKWLTGTLIRNGPGAWDTEDGNLKVAHWFDGLAMLHRFSFDNGRVSFGNRFLRSESYDVFMNAKKRGEPRELGGFTRDPCRALFGKAMTVYETMGGDNASVHVHPLDEQVVAMTETPMPVAFDV
ncbi:MAG: carotenoid oxygenase family protein, partial [Planctomycetota bacterium]